MSTLHEDLCTFMIASLQMLLRMRNVSDKKAVEKKTQFIFSNFFLKIILFMR
jgi:hypothetical protein